MVIAMTQKHKYKATPRFIALIAAVCFAFACVVFLTQQAKLKQIRLKEEALSAEYAAIQAEQQRLEYMIEYAKSDEYRIQYAREKLGLVLPDDIKFNIEE